MENPTISVQELQRLLTEKKPVYVLDVRPQEQRDEWHIAESFHKDAYGPLNRGDQTVLNDVEIPKNTPVVTVCAAGKTSLLAAEALSKRGYQAYSLEGGMKAWNYAWDTAEFTLSDSVTTVVQIKRVAKGCLSYIVGSGNEAVVIDAALDPNVYVNLAQSKGWTIRYVMDTHVHADYLSRTKELAEATGAQHIFIEEADVEYSFTPVKDQQEIPFGHATLKILHTSGHTPESTSYFINEEALFTGDTLFTDGVGRPDLKANKEEVDLQQNFGQ
jgi:rhodanese-related sulfurtransferase